RTDGSEQRHPVQRAHAEQIGVSVMTTGCGCPQRQASAGSQVTLVEGGTDAAFLPIRPGRARPSAGRSPGCPGGGNSMAFVDCTACADRYRRHWAGIVCAILLSPLFWAWAALPAL